MSNLLEIPRGVDYSRTLENIKRHDGTIINWTGAVAHFVAGDDPYAVYANQIVKLVSPTNITIDGPNNKITVNIPRTASASFIEDREFMYAVVIIEASGLTTCPIRGVARFVSKPPTS